MAKKKKDAHHGGAWKVAYADFVTAMMALFLVLWICGQNEAVRQATSRYFQDPYHAIDTKAVGLMDQAMAGRIQERSLTKPDARPDSGFLQALAQEFFKLLNVKDEDENPVDVEVTSEGMKITVYDRPKKPVFEKNSAELTQWGQFVVQTLAWMIERYEFKVYIDGHTPKGFPQIRPEYGPWELSADRANAARRRLEFYAVASRKMERVTGFGETIPLPNLPPTSESNQRITVSLSLMQQQSDAPAKTAPASTPDSSKPKTVSL
jgi:chemotaxis protein MotB